MSDKASMGEQGQWLAALRDAGLRSRLLFHGLFLGNFAIAKVAIYAAPIAIAAVASGEVYGGIELAQSIGLLMSSLLIGAPLAGITQQYLVRRDGDVLDQLALMALIFCSLTLVASAIVALFPANRIALLVCAAFASAVVHNTVATWFRMRAQRNLTAWADGIALLLAAAIVGIVMMLTGKVELEPVTWAYLIFAAICASLSALILIHSRRSRLFSRAWESAIVGAPMIVVGTLATWLGVGGRITVGFLDASNVAAYGVAFRIAGLSLGIHQLAVTALFARIYRARTREADRLLAPFFAGVGLLSCMIALSGPLILYLFDFESLDTKGNETFVSILPMTCIQVFYWIGYAMLQLRINRAGLAARAIWPTAALTIGGGGAIILIARMSDASIQIVCWMIALHSAAYFFLNCYVLARLGRLPHRLVMQVGLFGGGVMAALAVVLVR